MARFARATLLVSTVGLAAVLAQPATAQSTASPDPKPASPKPTAQITDTSDANTIIVTGSRLKSSGIAIQPTVVLGAVQIHNLGYTNLADALSELPQFGVPGNSSVGAQSGFGAGQSFLDFFSLGTQRTLTLVNGRRFVSSNTASIFGPVDAGSQVDYNVIPEALVDRVEIIAIGGAPNYGSDAIAGTVNIILKKKFDGFKIEATNGISSRKDAGDHRISAIAGKSFADGRGNILVSGEWTTSDGLATADRFLTSSRGPFYTSPNFDGAPYQNQLYYNERLNVFTQYGTPLVGDSIPEFAGVSDANGNVLTFNQQGRLVPLDFGTRTGNLITSAGGNGFNIGDFGNLKTSSERYLGTAIGSFRVSDALRVFGEAWYSRSKATNLLDQPYYSTALFDAAGTANGNLIVSLDNPFLNPADRATIAANLGEGQDSFLLTRANTDLQSGTASSVVELYRFVGGVDGDFHILGKPWHYEASLNYGRSKTTSRAPNLVFQNLLNALNATTDGSGNIICAPGYTSAPIATLNSSCSPIDIFGQSNTATQRAAIDYMTAIARSTSVDTQFVANINAQGSLLTLPGGDVTMSIGYEHRRESTSFDPGAFYYGETLGDGTRQGFGNSIPIDPIAGSFHTDEGFAELRVPVVSPDMGWRFLDKLELDASARYVRNSLSGGSWTYTGGGKIAPIEDITFRGNFTHAIRSPAITEVFNPTSPDFQSGNDPCDARYINNGPDPARRQANCRAAGVPIDQPGGFDSNYSDFTVPGSVSGNRNLTNEQANSYTFGAVIAPRFLPGLSLSADYVNISIKDEIVSLSGDDILAACYDAADYPNSFCADAPRDGSGQITFIKAGYYNAAIAKLKAVTAQFAYAFDLGRIGLGPDAGSLGLTVNYYHVIDQYKQVGTGDIDHSVGEIGNPKDSFTANLNYAGKKLNILWQTQYYGPSKLDADAPASTYQYPVLKRWYLFNASVGYTLSEHFDLTFIVDNVFDKRPPYTVPADGGTITYFAGLLGRYFKVSVGAKF